MATPQLSPGVLVREVDLTIGRAENVLDNIGGIAGPFPIGPVNEPIEINTEQELIDTFGKPQSSDAQYEYFMTASSFLTYGGVLKVVRVGGGLLFGNANAGVGVASTSMTGSGRIDSYDDYITNHSEATNFTFAAKNPGSWANNLKVCFIDDFADQTIGINSVSLSGLGCTVGAAITASIGGYTVAGVGTANAFTGYLKGVVTGMTTDTTNGENSTVDVKIVCRVETVGGGSTITKIDYAEGNVGSAFTTGSIVWFGGADGLSTNLAGYGLTISDSSLNNGTGVQDWYDQQTLGLTNSTVYWKSIAPRPKTSKYATERDSKNDGLHVVVVDDLGRITGIQGNVVEKHLNLSKALDAVSAVNAPQKIWYEQYLADYSEYIYAGGNPGENADSFWGTTPQASGFSTSSGSTGTPITTADGTWGLDAQGTTFNVVGNTTYKLLGGNDYSSGVNLGAGTTQNGYTASLGDLMTAYDEFSNKDKVAVDYLIMGPGCSTKAASQAKANKLISLANSRKDCVATIGPHRADLIGITNTDTQTTNLLDFFSPLTSSSYAVFDSGYKYTYDRFNNKFRYIPTNGDIAGLMVRTAIQAYPWFSPAGQQRGMINNAIKLAYNPDKAQRDLLYPQRVNSVVTQPGLGTLLFGDKTGLGYASAFDRINVRRLFLTVEQALQKAAEAQLFELNDELTRANFRNIVEPYLRDVQAKRGVYGFLVVCDSTNNTPDVIDNNEFRADIFLKPAKSINYVTLTFVATRTGVSFEEVAGTV